MVNKCFNCKSEESYSTVEEFVDSRTDQKEMIPVDKCKECDTTLVRYFN